MLSSWDDLRYLEALARRGSARAAGRELGVAASTVYRRVASLEKSVGFPCLDRGHGVTAAGFELAELARSAGASFDAIARRAHEARTEVRGVLRLTTIDGFAPLLIAPLHAIAMRHPSLRVDVHVAETGGPSLRRRQADLAISIVEDPPTSLVSRRLFPVRWAVYGTRAVAAEPHRARWVRLGPPHDTTWLGQWETKHVPDARVAIATPSRRLLVELVASGAGLGLLPVRLAAEVPGLVEVPMYAPLVGELTRPAWLFTNPDVRRDARVMAVSRVLLEHLKD